jgi:hypothetical protein
MPSKPFRIIHASGNTFMPLVQTLADIERMMGHSPDLVALTETGQNSVVRAIRHLVGKHMQVENPDRGDITFLVKPEHHVLDLGGPLAIPGQSGSAALGGHGPRHNSFVTLDLGDGDVLTHTAVHLVTQHAHHAHGGPDRSAEQIKQANLVGQQMMEKGAGHRLATGSGDLNTALPGDADMQRVFDHYSLVTTAQETGDEDPTHGVRRIDYVWTFDQDRRLSVAEMKVLPGFHSDHHPVLADLNIRALH